MRNVEKISDLPDKVYHNSILSLLKFVANIVCIPGGGVLHNFQYGGGSMPMFRVRNLTSNQYLGSVNDNMDKTSIFWVHKSEKRKNHRIWCGSPKY